MKNSKSKVSVEKVQKLQESIENQLRSKKGEISKNESFLEHNQEEMTKIE